MAPNLKTGPAKLRKAACIADLQFFEGSKAIEEGQPPRDACFADRCTGVGHTVISDTRQELPGCNISAVENL